MMKKFLILFSIAFLVTYCLCDELEEDVEETEKIDTSKYYRAQVEVCMYLHPLCCIIHFDIFIRYNGNCFLELPGLFIK